MAEGAYGIRWSMEEFRDKLDWEGGLVGLLEWGGPAYIAAVAPDDIKELVGEAARLYGPLELLKEEIYKRLK